jgi:hypothetical protein
MALGAGTFSSIGGAVNDIFSSYSTAQGLKIKAQGDLAEGQAYDLGGGLARQNAQFTEQSTAIKQMQQQRELGLTLGRQAAGVASSGFEATGTSLDLLRDSAAQGALTKAVLGQQGLITEAGYKEQAQSYDIMSAAAKSTAQQEQDLASTSQTMGYISAGIKAVSAIASLA